MKYNTGINCFIVLFSSSLVAKAAPPIAWARQIGTSSVDIGWSVAVDHVGNAFLTGQTLGNLGGLNTGSYDAFLSKFDPAGNVVWTRQIGTNRREESRSVTVDSAGNVLIAGVTEGSLREPSAGGGDAFLVKFDTLGNELWSRQIGTNTTDFGQSVAVDGLGNAYLTGYTYGSLGGANAGDADAYLTKFDITGNELWTRQFGTSSFDFGVSVATNNSGDVYVSGRTDGDLVGPNAGSGDAFLIKLDDSGNEVWARQWGTSELEAGVSVAVDAEGNAYITGQTLGSLAETNAGLADAFLAKFDVMGNVVWTRQMGTSSFEISHSVAVDLAGDVYITGFTYGELAGTQIGPNDLYLFKFNSAGDELWSQQIGSGRDSGWSVTVSSAGNIYVGGSTTGELGPTRVGGEDAFLIKFAVPESSTASLIVVSSFWALSGAFIGRRGGRKFHHNAP
jgi:hypothetical protein